MSLRGLPHWRPRRGCPCLVRTRPRILDTRLRRGRRDSLRWPDCSFGTGCSEDRSLYRKIGRCSSPYRMCSPGVLCMPHSCCCRDSSRKGRMCKCFGRRSGRTQADQPDRVYSHYSHQDRTSLHTEYRWPMCCKLRSHDAHLHKPCICPPACRTQIHRLRRCYHQCRPDSRGCWCCRPRTSLWPSYSRRSYRLRILWSRLPGRFRSLAGCTRCIGRRSGDSLLHIGRSR